MLLREGKILSMTRVHFERALMDAERRILRGIVRYLFKKQKQKTNKNKQTN